MSTAVSTVQMHNHVQEFVSTPRKMFIDGKWVEAASGKTFPTYNPATGEVLAQVAEGDREDIDRAVKAARRAFESGPWHEMTASQRGRMIWKLGDLIEEHLEEFAQLESLDNGKPLSVARVADVPLAADLFHYMAGWATKIEGNTDSDFGRVEAREVLCLHPARARRSGGPDHPVEFSAADGGVEAGSGAGDRLHRGVEAGRADSAERVLLLAELMAEAGFPDGVVNVVPGYGETAGAALASHPDVDKIAFTGSTEVGRLILQAAAGNLKKVSLELGGKSPNLVFADADMKATIPGAAGAIFFNHGQCCCAGSRLYVEQSIFDHVVHGVAEQAKKIKLGPGFDPETSMGPLVSEEQMNRVCSYLESGLHEGAEAIVGGHKRPGSGYFVEPTVMVKTKPDMKVVREEIFGPVVCAMPFRDVDKLIAEANQSEYGLAAAVWTRDISKAHRIAEKLRAGTVWINCYNVFDAALPFGGYKQSGWGREMGHEALELYTEVKAVCAAILGLP